jgi:eukaryotic-like serine/threonine-protein kinase
VNERLSWETNLDDGTMKVRLSGPINEDANFAPLLDELQNRGKIRFNFSGIDRINSCGVREWVNFVRSFPHSVQLEMEQCTPVVVSQLNMISNFAGEARVLSVQAPFVCDACGHEEDILLRIADGNIPDLESVACPKCHAPSMEFDDLEDSYFAFLG